MNGKAVYSLIVQVLNKTATTTATATKKMQPEEMKYVLKMRK